MRSRSRRTTAGRLLAVTVLAAVVVPLSGVLGLVRTSNRVIIPEGETITDDLYAFAGSVTIEGTLDGDLIAVVGEVTITGKVTGDVLGLAGRRVRIDGSVDGSVRLVAPDIEIGGRIGDDIAALAVGADLDAVVGRDLLVIAGRASADGTIGRDLRGQVWSLDVGAEVGNDVLARVDRLRIEEGARIMGDVIYRASADADVADSAVVHGSLIRSKVLSPVWAKATERALAVLGLLGFIVGGLLMFWVFRKTAARAALLPGERPFRVVLVGLALVILPPLVVVPLSLTLVGLPVALLILVLWLIGLFLGAVPAVTWVGQRLIGGRGGWAAALVVGAVLWRGSMWLLPLAAVLLYVAGVVVGLGAFALAGWEGRAGNGPEWRPLPPDSAPKTV